MATLASPKPSSQGTATAPTQTQVEGNPGSPGAQQAELDSFLAAGLGAPDLSGLADRGPADLAEPVIATPAKAPKAPKAKPTEPSPDFANPPDNDDVANPTDLSSLIEAGEETDEDEDGEETEEIDDEEAAPSDDHDEDTHPGDGNKLPKGIQKRLSKLTERSKEFKTRAETAEAEAARLKAENQALAANRVVAAPTPNDPLADVVDTATLDQRLAAARAALEWCDENVEGGVIVDAKGNETEMSMKEVAQRRRFLERLVNEHAPKRRQWLDQRQAATEAARQVYPTLYKDGTTMGKVRTAMLQNMPGIAAHPDADIFIGDAVIGAMVRDGQLRVFKAGKAAPATGQDGTPKARETSPRTPPRAAPAPAPSANPNKQGHAALIARAEAGDSAAMQKALELGLI